MQKISLKDAEALLGVLNGDYTRESTFSKRGKVALKEMSEGGIVTLKRENARTRSVVLINRIAFNNHITQAYGIASLEGFIQAMRLQNPTRSELTDLGEDDKVRSVNPKSGMHINSPDAIEVRINGQQLTLSFPEGCALFVDKNTHLEIDEDVLIVGIENFENIKFSLKERALLPVEKKLIFVERGPVLREYLKGVPNEYLHFGDFDLPGIFIYQTEYAPIAGERGNFFVPTNINDLIKQGTTTLHDVHLKKYASLTGITSEIESLIGLIKREKRRLPQEFFLKTSS